MSDTSAVADIDHPSPRRDRAALPALAAVWAGPIAWCAQLLVDYALASHACFPASLPLNRPSFEWVHPVQFAVNLLAALVALAGAALSLRHWQRTRDERPGPAARAVESPETRTRFLALCGMMTGFGFLVATLFDTVALVVVPPCSG